MRKEVAVYGTFHLARICGFLIMADLWGDSNRKKVRSFAEAVYDDGVLQDAYERAMEILLPIREASLGEQPNPALYFKATEAKRSIERALESMT